jgi:hypothetical protein
MKQNNSPKVSMTPEEQAIVNKKLTEVAEILYKNTPSEELKTFETVELSVREHLLKTVAPEIGNFFFTTLEEKEEGESEK